MSASGLKLKVAALTDIAPSLRHVRLVAADGGKLPPAAAGAHIQLVLAGPGRSFRNAYSLVSRLGARDAWDIIVRRVRASRGGSAYIHEQLQAGDTLEAGWPGNLFAPVRTARRHLMIAGGIGITPFIARMQALCEKPDGKKIDLFYSTSAPDAEFIRRLRQRAEQAGVTLHVVMAAEQGRLTPQRVRELVPEWAQASVWFCGPASFGQALRDDWAAQGRSPDDFHQELFEMR